MKCFLVSVVSFIFFSNGLWGFYNGNPSDIDLINRGLFVSRDLDFYIKATFLRDFVFDYNMCSKNDFIDTVDKSRSSMDLVFLNVVIFDRLKPYVNIGGGRISFILKEKINANKREVFSKNNFMFGYGAAIVIYRGQLVTFGMDAKYQTEKSSIKFIKIADDFFSPSGRIRLSMWQISSTVSFDMIKFYPYVGLNYNRRKASFLGLNKDIWFSSDSLRLESLNKFGIILGVSVAAERIFSGGLEFRFFNEKAVSFAVNMRF